MSIAKPYECGDNAYGLPVTRRQLKTEVSSAAIALMSLPPQTSTRRICRIGNRAASVEVQTVIIFCTAASRTISSPRWTLPSKP
jgi:hypothetical protein